MKCGAARALCALSLSSSASAATYTWGGASGNWNDASKWVPNTGVPGAADTATINGGAVTLSADASVAALNVAGGTLALAADTCPAGWASQGGSGAGARSVCFKGFVTPLSWKDAERYCQAFSRTEWYGCMEGHERTSTFRAREPAAAAAAAAGTTVPAPYTASASAKDEHPNLSRRSVAAPAASAWKGLPGAAMAEGACAYRQDGHLANIGSAGENELVHGLCRELGLAGTGGDGACWIGLTDNATAAAGRWQWTDQNTFAGGGGATKVADPRYRAWARGEPSHSEVPAGAGEPALPARGHAGGGNVATEHCAALRSYARAAGVATHRADWGDFGCASKRAFVCQKGGATAARTLTVGGAFGWSGGTITGHGGSLAVGGAGTLSGGAKALTGGAALLLSGAGGSWTGGDLAAGGGARVRVGALFEVRTDADVTKGAGALATIVVGPAGRLVKAAGVARTEIAAAVELEAGGEVAVSVGGGASLSLDGGGVAGPGSKLVAGAAGSVLRVGGAETRLELSSVREQTLLLSAAAPVLALANTVGHFKITVGGVDTACLPYHASAAAVEAALNALPRVIAAGRAKVHRDGDGGALWSYGYRFHITYDRASEGATGAFAGYTTAAAAATLTVVKKGGGAGMGCADVLTPAVRGIALAAPLPARSAAGLLTSDVQSEVIGVWSCPAAVGGAASPAAAAGADAAGVPYTHTCVVAPAFAPASVHAGGAATLSGLGTFELAAGSHLLPHACAVAEVKVSGSAVATVAASRVTFAKKVAVGGMGVLALGGAGFEGLDATYLVYRPEDFAGRDDATLLAPPALAATAAEVALDGAAGAELRVVGPGSTIGADRVTFKAGAMLGPCTLTAAKELLLDGPSAKKLKHGFEIVNVFEGRWVAGDIVGSEGALLHNAGILSIESGADFLWGRPHAPSRCWHNGWYPNPLCAGAFCAAPPVFSNGGVVRKGGDVATASPTETRFEATFDSVGIVEVQAGSIKLDGNGTLTGDDLTVLDPDPVDEAAALAAAAAAKAAAQAAADDQHAQDSSLRWSGYHAGSSTQPNATWPLPFEDRSFEHACVCGNSRAYNEQLPGGPGLALAVADGTSLLHLKGRTSRVVPHDGRLRLHLPPPPAGQAYNFGALPTVYMLAPAAAMATAYWADAIDPVLRSELWSETSVNEVTCAVGSHLEDCECLGIGCKGPEKANRAAMKCVGGGISCGTLRRSCQVFGEPSAKSRIKAEARCVSDFPLSVLEVKLQGSRLDPDWRGLAYDEAWELLVAHQWNVPSFNATNNATHPRNGNDNLVNYTFTLPRAKAAGLGLQLRKPEAVALARANGALDYSLEDDSTLLLCNTTGEVGRFKRMFEAAGAAKYRQITIQCPSGCREYIPLSGKTKSVWGGSPEGQGMYTSKSAVCLAALHATGEDGGVFRITYVPPAKYYPKFKRHGIETGANTNYPASFVVRSMPLTLLPQPDTTRQAPALYTGPSYTVSFNSFNTSDYAIHIRNAYLNAANVLVTPATDESLACRCRNNTPYVHPVITQAPLPLGTSYLPKFSAGFVLSGPTSKLVFGAGAITVDAHFFMGAGVVEFVGGRHAVLVSEVDAEVRVAGGAVEFESPWFSMVDANDRDDPQYAAPSRYRFSLTGGLVNFTAVAPQLVVNGNMLLAGGVLAFPRQAGVSNEFLLKRGMVRVANRVAWNGATLDGNCDLFSGGGMSIGGGTKVLKSLWRVINYAEAKWIAGDIVSDEGSAFLNKGTLESSGEATARVAVDPHVHHRGPTQFLHAWA